VESSSLVRSLRFFLGVSGKKVARKWQESGKKVAKKWQKSGKNISEKIKYFHLPPSLFGIFYCNR
jgi:hypothetical protein